ncbi:phage tail-like protein [Humibacillus xanthopallidus]|uniref:Phage tail-like protein n=1 Tax=Humibacillus xanthopallidus TaxID=412689 RepID=A0A543PWU6_9MICO|nr:phage tail protein [Humibacillus xanthopallidus]TQN48558.1 phage tail-like protein [Humibacillus xanthopallidus]
MIHQTFNFLVRIDTGEGGVLCEAAFAECAGLEMSAAPKTIREGGNNVGPVHLAGPVSYGTLALKRGMSERFDLWSWFDSVHRDGGRHRRADCQVEVRTPDGTGTAYTLKLVRCLPVKLKAPDLHAKDGGLAIEELEIAYEGLRLIPPAGGESGG